jgi:Ca2+-binding RTX toxin-like protein
LDEQLICLLFNNHAFSKSPHCHVISILAGRERHIRPQYGSWTEQKGEAAMRSYKKWSKKFATTNGDDTIVATDRSDVIFAKAGNDQISETGMAWAGRKTDMFFGGAGDDTILTRWGKDIVNGGADNDVIQSRSDAGEPEIAQDPNLPTFNDDQPFSGKVSNDVLTGGGGSDTFRFRLDLDARPEIAAKHADANGVIDWHEVAGENGEAHLHWVNSIGTDVITDFRKAEGDKIEIEGHTATIDITYADRNNDGREESIIKIRSDQGGAGSHDGDQLGTIIVYGDRVEEADVSVNADVHHGAYETISELLLA